MAKKQTMFHVPLRSRHRIEEYYVAVEVAGAIKRVLAQVNPQQKRVGILNKDQLVFH